MLDISLRVANTGKVEGDEVIQFYIHDEYASTPRPIKELKGYIRLSLKPGEEKTVVFQMNVNQLAFYNNDLELILEPGSVEMMLGSSSEDIRLSGSIEIVGKGSSIVKERVLSCPVTIK